MNGVLFCMSLACMWFVELDVSSAKKNFCMLPTSPIYVLMAAALNASTGTAAHSYMRLKRRSEQIKRYTALDNINWRTNGCMQGDLPDALSIRILQAPISWMLPVNKHTPFRPPFRIAVDVVGHSAPQESISLLPQLVSKGEIHNGAFCAYIRSPILHTRPADLIRKAKLV